MKNFLLTAIAISFVFMGCEKEEKQPNPANPSVYTIEGRWVLELYPNTMYIFENGLRYTVYCVTPNCDWDTVTIASALPNPENYTFENDTLKIDLGFGNSISDFMDFVCGGEVIKREYDAGQYVRWSRPSYDIANCNE